MQIGEMPEWECQKCGKVWMLDGVKRAVRSKHNPDCYEWQYSGTLLCSCRGGVRKIEAQEGEIVMEREVSA